MTIPFAAERYPASRPISPADIHLQWFAAEDEGRTEEPSEYKLRKAREEGRVPKSQELIGAVGLLMPLLAIAALAPSWFATMKEMLVFFLSRSVEMDPVTGGGAIGQAFLGYFVRLAWPPLAVGFLSAIFSNVLQVGALFTTKPLVPDFSRIVPRFGQYLKKTLFSAEGAYNAAKTVLKLAVIGAVVYVTIAEELDRLRSLFSSPLWLSVKLIASLALRLLVEVAVILLALSIPDYMFQRRQFMEGLKMTKEEVKEERKMQEGDPLVKSRLRQRMRELLSRNMAANVPKADVVITNPTHFAVAVEWDKATMKAPTVTAKGADEIAQRIKAIATGAGVPLVENRPLARALYAEVEIGDMIPDKYYQAMAAVLAHVYRMDGRSSSGEAEREVV